MARIEARLRELGLVLPAPLKAPAGLLPFAMARVVGGRALIAGHGPLNPDGTLAAPLGKVGREVSAAEAYSLARLTGLAMLSSLKRAIDDLDRVHAWTRAFGMVNVAPGFNDTPSVINGFSDLILELYGPEIGAHARSAVGMAELPFNIAVEIEAEVEIAS
jgi:enamine deaminase RidA (YjgF/YER057c/UK114 family)